VGSQFAALAADFNHDGKLDFMNGIEFGFARQWRWKRLQMPLAEALLPMELLGVGDLNGTEFWDAVLPAATAPPQMGINLGKGDGTFSEAALFPNRDWLRQHILVLIRSVGDFNSDGKLDVIPATASAASNHCKHIDHECGLCQPERRNHQSGADCEAHEYRLSSAAPPGPPP